MNSRWDKNTGTGDCNELAGAYHWCDNHVCSARLCDRYCSQMHAHCRCLCNVHVPKN